ncbi:MAG: hypothetical protein BMS9Abin23_1059 [Thermodesulfobacteriota bacterium]|nr:MAG: hypothetical protein BMS9Abin23_1059 [Thermodesulfobacteriota bacterium]
MKRWLLTGVLVLGAALFIKADDSHSATGTMGVAGSVSAYTAGLSANGVVRSRHNLGDFGRVIKTESTTQVCVFCHTPHHTNTTAAPLWNRSTSNSVNYVAYGTTLAGSTINNADFGGATLACLSCHDGETAFDSLVNAPGKGGVTFGGGATEQSWKFSMPGIPGLKLDAWDHFGSPGTPNVWCQTCHPSSGSGFAYNDTWSSLSLGTDISNDHPVSVVYSASTKASLRPTNTTISMIDLSTGLENTTIYFDNMQQNRWAVSGFISSTATIGDLLRNNKVECSSCHDPHFRNLSWDESDATYDPSVQNPSRTLSWCTAGTEDCSDGLFLRRVGGNTGSGVCRTCHNK